MSNDVSLRTYVGVTFSSVASSASSVTLVAANPARKGLIIQNTSTQVLYALLGGGTATATTSHSLQIAPNAYFDLGAFTGAVTGIWASANGSANITEIF